MDFAATELLSDLQRAFVARGVDLRVARANQQVAELLAASDLADRLGGVREDETIASVVDRWRRERDAT